ncbi:flavodoxin family protein [Pseudomonas syringae pv. actinidiae]|uniref:FMN reductase n=6 Tax=Pseudomonas syringae group TaxID=136849 RepID=A0A0Q0AI68_PSEAJ|nr:MULTISPECIES: flavodoxin family protein [Pseudomonas syringae group]EPN65142.1 nadph-dependent fmn reductase [Pseudomonas syringae pv. actinidiae ICMP 19101]AKT33626.1 FMN reductase [Pseudomonas syringae pv. actinidiae ICMP 18884]AOE60185.1 FMN reductase [Pseudomonas syringae pv. actinidiae ICMP 18708]APQ01151.1 FMN reductase [Pseudomonas syringae pv. actinidiae]APQ06886.1 FMN reductase [Pseudomonas syringae pv. actinidiae]
MKLTVIVGSSRPCGVSARVVALVRRHLGGQAEVEEIWLKDYRIEYCDADNACAAEDCAVQDDVEPLVTRIASADALLYLPVMHAYGLNSRFQAFLERMGYGFMRPRERPLRDKLAAIAVVGRRYGHTAVFSQVVLNVLLNKMILVGSGFPPCFQTQLAHDPEAEQALRETLDRLTEHHHRLHPAWAQAEPPARPVRPVHMLKGTR